MIEIHMQRSVKARKLYLKVQFWVLFSLKKQYKKWTPQDTSCNSHLDYHKDSFHRCGDTVILNVGVFDGSHTVRISVHVLKSVENYA
jgi:hypothetical protein